MNPKLKKILGLDKPKRNFAFILCAIALHFTFPRYVVATGSMEPTIPVGAYVLAFRGAYLFSEPKKGDIVIFEPVDGISTHHWTHRVIGLEGEDFTTPNYGERRDTDDASSPNHVIETITIPRGYVYQSGDSSKSYHGLAKSELIRARALFFFTFPWKKNS